MIGVLTTGLFMAVLMNPVSGETVAPKAVIKSEAIDSGAYRMVASFKAGLAPLKIDFSLPMTKDLEGLDVAPEAGPAQVLAQLSYDLESITDGRGRVPRLFLASLPPALAEIRETKKRKNAFFKTVLPLILQVNEDILADRKRLWDLRYRKSLGQRIGAADRLWLIVMAERYNVERGDLDGLLKRVDVIVPSMALAQAATESGWGTSRFVREGNAMFGEWTFSKTTQGLAPLSRDEGKTHRVRIFDSLIDSVRSYAGNLNTHRAYVQFRDIRHSLRARGAPLDGMILAGGLIKYSERGAEYVDMIRSMISANDLRRLDDARLLEEGAGPRPII
jgi:Bax protein